MEQDLVLRTAYDSGLKCGMSLDGMPSECPFETGSSIAERIAWMSGFSVGKAVKFAKR